MPSMSSPSLQYGLHRVHVSLRGRPRSLFEDMDELERAAQTPREQQGSLAADLACGERSTPQTMVDRVDVLLSGMTSR